ncbi:MAG: type II toxin-antitoxin system HicB family antitoxin [Spirochaetes bacterium]|nr:type II toxin-antitoxin system HicB family antitoxin [Spirochaetota bacterium]
MKISIVIERDSFGFFAFAPELPGCQTQGTTFEEADANIREAIDLFLETLDPDELAQLDNSAVYTTTYEVAGV